MPDRPPSADNLFATIDEMVESIRRSFYLMIAYAREYHAYSPEGWFQVDLVLARCSRNMCQALRDIKYRYSGCGR